MTSSRASNRRPWFHGRRNAAALTFGGRSAMHRHLADLIASGSPVTLALIEIDGLEVVQLVDGTDATDALINEVGRAIKEIPGTESFRLADGRFAIVVPTPVSIAEERCEELTTLSSGATVCIGLASSRPTDEPITLHTRGRKALEVAQRRGRGSLAHAPRLPESSPKVDGARAAAVIKLLRDGAVRVHYQPIVATGTRQPVAFEALARPQLTHDLGGPVEAFATAERLGMVTELDALCRASILEDGPGLHMPPDTRLHINLDPLSLGHRSLNAGAIMRLARASELRPNRIVLEIHEDPRVAPADFERELRKLRELGFRLALDDVGGDSAGLVSLRLGLFDVIKLSRSVIAGIGEDRHTDGVLDAVCGFAARTGVTVVAEGVETAEQLYRLRTYRHPGLEPPAITAVQGYHIGGPAPQPGRPMGPGGMDDADVADDAEATAEEADDARGAARATTRRASVEVDRIDALDAAGIAEAADEAAAAVAALTADADADTDGRDAPGDASEV